MMLLQQLSANIRILRAPLLLAVLAFFVLSSPAQVLELYLLLARDWARLWPQAVFAAASITVLSFLIAYISRVLVRARNNDVRATPIALVGTARGAPVLLGVLPLAGAALGLYRALRSVLTEDLVGTTQALVGLGSDAAVAEALRKLDELKLSIEKLSSGSLSQLNLLAKAIVPQAILDLPTNTEKLVFGIYAAIACCGVAAMLLLIIFGRKISSPEPPGKPKVFHPAAWALILASLALLTGAFAAQYLNAGAEAGFDYTSIPRTFGTLALVSVCLIFLVYFCSLFTYAADRNGVPVIAPLIVLAIILSILNWNDNHAIRQLTLTAAELDKRRSTTAKSEGDRNRMPPFVTYAFDDWLAARPQEYVKKFDGKPYPIYAVAAQGGGMYAANLSGLALARLYDRCPAIRHHIFAVSGVSGGSVGAGYFAALLNDPQFAPRDDSCTLSIPANGKGTLESKMENLLRADFLSPVAANFLFPDLIQRFLPVTLEVFDRARSFEAGLETAWDEIVGRGNNPLRAPFSRQWMPNGAAPMLLLNVTVVETGRQVAISPVELAPGTGFNTFGPESLHESLGLAPKIDLPLSTAMSLSARFPVVMPAGNLKLDKFTARLVDGGYFDNSGVETAMFVLERLRDHVCRQASNFSNCVREKSADTPELRLSFKTFVLTDFDPLASPLPYRQNEGDGLNEILSPVRAMFNVRVARGDYTSGRLIDFRAPRQDNVIIGDDPTVGPNDVPVMRVSLNHRLYALPLGWQISAQVQNIIAAQIGEPSQCGFGRRSPAYKEAIDIITRLSVGLRAVADGKAGRKNVDRELTIRRTFGQLYPTFNRLKDNQCAVFDALATDGLTAPLIQCQVNSVEEKVEFNVPPSVRVSELTEDKLKELTAPYQLEVKSKWEAKVEARFGKTWANHKVAIVTGGGCQIFQDGVSSCIDKLRPCDASYYNFLAK